MAPQLHGGDIPAELRGEPYAEDGDWLSRGHTAIVAPGGRLLTGPVIERADILYVKTDLAEVQASKREFDPVGHYARPDVFSLTVDTRAPRFRRVPDSLRLTSLPAVAVLIELVD
jgi:nitrilase